MKRLLIMFGIIGVSCRVSALSLYEPFANATAYGGTAYTVGSYLAIGGGPGVNPFQTNATGGSWSCISNNFGTPSVGIPTIVTNVLTYPGLTPSPGNTLFIPPATDIMGRTTLPFATDTNVGICYYSLLLQLTDISSLSTSPTTNYFAGFCDTTGTAKVPLARYEAYLVTKKNGTNYQIGIGKVKTTAANLAYDPALHRVGDVLFVVVSYDYSTAGHPASLWVNPPTNTFGAATPPIQPTVQVTNGSDLNSPGIAAFVLGCFSTAPPSCVVDDVRIAPNWAIATGAPEIHTSPSAVNVNAGTTANMSVFSIGAPTLNYQWVNSSGNLTNGGNISGANAATLSLSSVTAAADDNYYVVVSNAYGSATSTMASLTVNDPWINTPPGSQNLPPTANAVFTVVASGVPNLTYGWYKGGIALTNGGNISGANSASFTVSDISYNDQGQYTVYVTNGTGGVVESSPATLTVSDPAIITPPANATNNYGTTATFQVTASGQTTLIYQWSEQGVGALHDGGNISGSSSSALSIANVSYTNAGNYYVTVTDNAGTVPSSQASLTVIEPIITSQPVSATNTQQTTATFSVTAIGAPNITYLWSKNGTPLSDGNNISGSQSNTLTISSVSAGDAASYTVLVTDASGMSVNSATATLTVLTSPSITSEPAPLTIEAGNTAAFAFGVTGASPITYQWYSNTVPISLATNFAYVLTNVQLGMGGDFWVIASNYLGAATSSMAGLSVVPSIQLYNTNIVVVRVGNGAQTQTFNGNSVFLDQYTTTGTYLNTICVPDSGASALVEIGPDVNGSTVTGTELSLTANGMALVLSGYNTPQPYTAALYLTTAGAVPRGIGLVDSTGEYTLAVTSKSAFSQTYFRGATSDGSNNFWGVGNADGTYYFGNSAPSITNDSTYPNLRSINIFNGNLYVVSGASGQVGVFEWTGLPTNATAPTELFIPGATATDMAIDPTSSIMYLSTSVGVMRYYFDGTYWDYDYTVSTYPVRYVTADFTQNPPVVYATTSDSSFDHLIAVVDNGPGSPLVTLATAGLNENLRGVRFGPNPLPTEEISVSTDPTDIILTWPAPYTLQSSTNVAGPYTNVPSATSPYTNAFGSASQMFFRLSH